MNLGLSGADDFYNPVENILGLLGNYLKELYKCLGATCAYTHVSGTHTHTHTHTHSLTHSLTHSFLIIIKECCRRQIRLVYQSLVYYVDSFSRLTQDLFQKSPT